jgi:hypothetical protein
VVVTVVASAATGGYLVVRRRYQAAQDRIEFQIQSVIDLEARAYAQGDQDLFLEQQDTAAQVWYAEQWEMRGCLGLSQDTPITPANPTYGESESPCHPVLPAKLDRVNLQGDIAWVEVIEGEPPVRRVRFYRRTDEGWKHTAPRVDFWGVAVQLTYGDLIFRYHRSDQPYIDELIEHIYQAFEDVCTSVACPLEEPLEFDFAIENLPLRPSQPENGVFSLSSPWLTGLPLNGEWDPSYLNALTYWVTYEMTFQYLQSRTGPELGRLQRAMADEYAAWRSTPGAPPPLIRRLVDRHQEQIVITVLRSLEYTQSLNTLMAQWLRLSATEQPADYFETLLNMEREAILAGRKETFLLLQDDTRPEWMAVQEAIFDTPRSAGSTLPPIEVQTVAISNDLARVTLENPLTLPDGRRLNPRDPIVYFRRRDGDWKHSPPPSERAESIEVTTSTVVAIARTASPALTPTPDQRP